MLTCIRKNETNRAILTELSRLQHNFAEEMLANDEFSSASRRPTIAKMTTLYSEIALVHADFGRKRQKHVDCEYS